MQKEEKEVPQKARELRDTVAENVDLVMKVKGLDNRSVPHAPKSNVFRVRAGAGGTLDTIAMIAAGLDVEASNLLKKGWAREVYGTFLSQDADDKEKMAVRKPLMVGAGNGRTRRIIPTPKRKTGRRV